ncbi:MAG: tetratricopeptide repeat protein, partial [Candidatus Hydrogenedentes bacterium]|nr:tetratricopeptide repeat protein [Candidatus Hydrogenedentota bacterium]
MNKKYLITSGFIAILAINILIRVGYFYDVAHRADFGYPPHDAIFKEYWGHALVTGNWELPGGQRDPFEIVSLPSFPGYPYFIAIQYFFFGDSPSVIPIAQFFLGITTVCLFFTFAYCLWGASAALATMMLLTVYWIFPFMESTIEQVTLVGTLSILIILLLKKWLSSSVILLCKPTTNITRKESTAPNSFFLYLWVSLAAMTAVGLYLNRYEILPFILFIAVWIFVIGLILKKYKHAIFSTLIFILLVLPIITIIVLPIAKEYGSIGAENKLLFCNNAESSLTSDNCPYLNTILEGETWSYFTIPLFWDNYAKHNNIDPKNKKKMVAQMRRETLGFIRENPELTAKRVLSKAILTWTPEEIDENYVLAYEKEHSPILRYMAGFPLALAGFVFGLGAWLWHLFRDRKKWREKMQVEIPIVVLILAYIGVFFVVFLPFHVNGRYRIPMIPFMLLFGGYGIKTIVDPLLVRQWRKGLALAVVLLVLFALAHIEIIPFEPDLARWHDERRQAWTATDRLKEGVKDEQRWLDRHPEDAYGYYNQGVMLFELGKNEDALKKFNKALALKPDYDAVLYNKALTLFELGRFEESIRAFEERLQGDPKDADAWYGLSRTLEKTKKIPEQQTALEKAVALNPEHGAALVDLAVVYVDKGNYEKAFSLLHQVIDVIPEDIMAHFNLGLLLVKQGKYEAGLSHFEEAQKNTSDNSEIHYNTGLALLQLGRYEEAVTQFETTLDLQPESPEVYSNLGLCQARLGQNSIAEETFTKAFTLLPDAPDTYYNHGCALESAGNYAAARESFLQVLEIKPGHGKAHFELGLLCFKNTEWENALIHFIAACNVLPGDAEIPYNTGLVKQQQGNETEALRYFQEALDIDPKHYGANRSASPILRVEGNTEEAIRCLRIAIETNPDHADTQYELGVALHDIGEDKEA